MTLNDNKLEKHNFSIVNKKFKEVCVSHGMDLTKLDPMLKRLAANIRARVRTDRDFYIAVTGPEGEGKSLDKKTKIVYLDDKGLSIDEIQNLYDKKNLKTLSINQQTLKVEEKEITNITKHDYNDELIYIKTNSGRELNGTLDHSFIVWDGKSSFKIVAGRDLKNGMLIPTLKNFKLTNELTNIKHNYKKNKHTTNISYGKESFNLTYNFGFLVGAYLAEGSLTSNAVCITNEDKIFINQLKKAVSELKNVNYSIIKKQGTNAISFNIHCVQLHHFLKEYFRKGSGNKIVAPFVFNSNDDFKKGLLNGYFSGDGIKIAVDYNGTTYYLRAVSGFAQEVSFTTKSKTLRDGICLLLNNYGIITTNKNKTNKKYGDYYVGRVVSSDIKKFSQLLTLHHAKNKVLKSIVNFNKIRHFNQINRIPITKELFAELRIGKGYSKRGLKTRDDVRSISTNIKRCVFVGYEMFVKHLDIFDNDSLISKDLMKLFNADFFFDKIKSINRKQVNDVVYDLSVKDNENFMLANGCFVHNSTFANLLGYLIDDNFDLEKNVIYSPTEEELVLKINYKKIITSGGTPPPGSLPPYSVINVDEAIKVVYKLEQWGAITRYLKKLMALARTENKIIILCIPDFLDMGNTFRSRMNYWIDIHYRGRGIVEARTRNKYEGDRWNLKATSKQYKKEADKVGYVNPLVHERIVKKISDNYVTLLTFPDLPLALKKQYEYFKNLHDYGDIEKPKAEDRYKTQAIRLEKAAGYLVTRILHAKLMIKKEIAIGIGYARPTIDNWIEKYKGSIEDGK